MVQLQIAFSATNQIVVTQVNQGLQQVSTRLAALSANALAGGAALRELQRELNRVAVSSRASLAGAFDFIGNGFNRIYSLARRFATITFAGMVGGAFTLGYALKKLGHEFISINEQFAGLEITMRSAFGSFSLSRDMRDFLAAVTSRSPIPFPALADLMRSASVIPFTRGQILKDVSSPGGVAAESGMVNRLRQLVERMIAFRPDKTEEDAIFAIRQALSGEFRSLIRRFSIPSSAIVAASGTTFNQVKADPKIAFEAMEKFFSGIITPQAVSQLIRQPTLLWQNILEQVLQIPLLRIGESGSYKAILDRVGYFYDSFVSFVESGLSPYAKKISDAFIRVLGAASGALGGVTESVLSRFGQGANDRPGVGLPERVYGAIAVGASSFADKLPSFVANAKAFFAVVIPAVEQFAKLVTSMITTMASWLTQAPIITTTVATLLYSFGPSLLASAKNRILDGLATGAATGLARFNSPNAVAGRAIQFAGPTGYQLPPGFATPLRGTGPTAIPIGAALPLSAGLAQSLLAQGGGSASSAQTAGALTGFARAVGPMIASIAVFVGGAYAIERASKAFEDATNRNIEALLQNNPSPDYIASVAGQFHSDTELIRTARKQQGELTRDPRFSGLLASESITAPGATYKTVGSGALQRLENKVNPFGSPLDAKGFYSSNVTYSVQNFIKDTESMLSAYERIQATLRDKTLSGSEPISSPLGNFNKGNTQEGGRQLSVLGRIILERYNQLENTYRNKGLTGVSPKLLPEFTPYLTDEQKAAFNNTFREASVGDYVGSHYQGGWLSDQGLLANDRLKGTFGNLSTSVNSSAQENLSITSRLSTFGEELKKQVTPGSQVTTDLQTLSEGLREINEAQAKLDEISSGDQSEDFKVVAAQIRTYVDNKRELFAKNKLDSKVLDQFNKDVAGPLLEKATSIESGQFKADQLLASQRELQAKMGEHFSTVVLLFVEQLDSFNKKLQSEDTGSLALESMQGAADAFVKNLNLAPSEAAKVLTSINTNLQDSLYDATKPGEFQTADKYRSLLASSKTPKLLADLATQRIGDLSLAPLEDVNADDEIEKLSDLRSKLILLSRSQQEQANKFKSQVLAHGAELQNNQAFGNLGIFGQAGQLGGGLPAEAATAEKAIQDLNKAMTTLGVSLPKSDFESFALLVKDSSDPKDVSNLIEKYQKLDPIIGRIRDELQMQIEVQKALAVPNFDYIQKLEQASQGLLDAQAKYQKGVESIQGSGVFSSMSDGIRDVTEQWNAAMFNFRSLASQTATSISSGFGEAFTKFAMATKNGSNAFRQFGIDISEMISKMMAQKGFEMIFGALIHNVPSLFGSAVPAGSSVGFGTPVDAGSGFGSGYATYAAEGAIITQGSGIKDDVPAMLMRGESVLNKRATAMLGASWVNAANQGHIRKLASGGVIGSVSSSSVANSANNYAINITVNASGGESSSTQGQASAQAMSNHREMARSMKAAVLSVLDEQRRLGGRFR